MFMNLQGKPNVDIEDFFKHESCRDPPSLSDKGKLYSGNKSELMDCLPGMPKPGMNAQSKKTSQTI